MTGLQLEALYAHHGGYLPLIQEGIRYLAEGSSNGTNETDHHDDDEYNFHPDEAHFGVHISYHELYNSILFLVCVYVSGKIASRLLKMPDLVGEIICGILLGPNLGKKE